MKKRSRVIAIALLVFFTNAACSLDFLLKAISNPPPGPMPLPTLLETPFQTQTPLPTQEFPTETYPDLFCAEVIASDGSALGGTLHVRSSPNADSNNNIIGEVKKGDQLITLGIYGEWTLVYFESAFGETGYVRNQYIGECK